MAEANHGGALSSELEWRAAEPVDEKIVPEEEREHRIIQDIRFSPATAVAEVPGAVIAFPGNEGYAVGTDQLNEGEL